MCIEAYRTAIVKERVSDCGANKHDKAQLHLQNKCAASTCPEEFLFRSAQFLTPDFVVIIIKDVVFTLA
jgi:hypothetical protein